MSRLDKLINELCPDGVEYKELKEICRNLKKGTLKKEELLRKGEYPVINSGRDIYGMYNKYNNEGNVFTIASRGEYAGFINYLFKKFWAGGLCYPYCSVDEKKIKTKYIYYYLKNIENYIKDTLVIRGSIPALNKVDIENLKIPVPPLEIQREIIYILDNFTLLLEELSEELKARKKQYEYYRNKLLKSYYEMDNTYLKDICEYSKERINASDLNDENYVGVDNLLQNKMGKTVSTHIPKEGNSTKYSENDILIGNIRPYLKKIWFADREGGTNGDVLVIHVISSKIIPEYLYCILSSDKFFDYDNNNAKGGKMPRGNKEAIMNYRFYLPSIEEQTEIVNILKKFELLCNDISGGLPAEIKARKKQYEYYRDKILNFKELQNK